MQDTKTTMIGAILAVLTAIQPAVAAFDGTFNYKSGIQVAFAAALAFFGYYARDKK